MCIFSTPEPTPMGTPPPITPRVETADSELPEARETITEDDTADVQIGSSTRESGGTAANQVGANALRINLNESASGANQTGGLNV